MEITSYEENNQLIVVPSGKLDTMNSPEFGKILAKLLNAKPQSCFLDMSKVSFLASSGLQVLLAGAKISRKENINFAIFGMSDMVGDLFILSGFNNFITTFSSKEEALV